MAPRRAKVNKFDYSKLTANDVLCPVCRSILIEPITLPCNHGFCASCFGPSTQNANVVCPLCRVRVGSWLRSATKSKKLINQTFWQAIQDLFPRQVQNKLNGIHENFTEDKMEPINSVVVSKNENSSKISNSSEIKSDTFLSKNNNKTDESVPSTSSSESRSISGSSENILNTLAKKFATKEYTCRILCQDVPAKKPTKIETLSLIQQKHKRIQKITESELLNSRSNSIESECLYFRPIDYRHNPPSEGLAPLKVPTRKPNLSSDVIILAPCGQNQINISSLESAFARLRPIVKDTEIIETEDHPIIEPSKRKSATIENNQPKKRLRSYWKAVETAQIKVKQEEPASKLLDDKTVVENYRSHNVKKAANVMKQISESLLHKQELDRSLQEKADFELAQKLQEKYNQYAQYSTRSRIKQGTAQRRIEGLMTQYTVK